MQTNTNAFNNGVRVGQSIVSALSATKTKAQGAKSSVTGFFCGMYTVLRNPAPKQLEVK